MSQVTAWKRRERAAAWPDWRAADAGVAIGLVLLLFLASSGLAWDIRRPTPATPL